MPVHSDGLTLDPTITASHRAPLQTYAVTTKQAAEILGVSERSIWNLIHDKQLPIVKINRATRLLTDELVAFLKNGGTDRIKDAVIANVNGTPDAA